MARSSKPGSRGTPGRPNAHQLQLADTSSGLEQELEDILTLSTLGLADVGIDHIAWRFFDSTLEDTTGTYAFAITRTTAKTRLGTDGFLDTVSVGAAAYTALAGGGSLVGVRKEKSRTNLLTYSEDLDLTGWTETDCTRATDAGVARMTGGTGIKITADTSSSISNIGHTFSHGAGHYCASIYFEPGTSDNVRLNCNYDTLSDAYVDVDLTDGSITGGTYVSAGTEEQVDGKWRVWLVFLAVGTDTGAFYANTHDGAGNTVSGEYCYVSCAQLEAVPYSDSPPSSWIPTTSAAAPRNSDLIQINDPSSLTLPTLFGSTGTGYAIYIRVWINHSPTSTDDKFVLICGKSDSSTYVGFRDKGDSDPAKSFPSAILDTGATRQDLEALGAIDIYQTWSNWAVGHELDNGLFYVNGNSIDPQVGSLPVMDPSGWQIFRIGSNFSGGTNECDDLIVSEIRLYEVMQSAAELDTLTS